MTKSVTITAPEGVPFIEFEREFDAPGRRPSSAPTRTPTW